MKNYIFQSKRLGFRLWKVEEDLPLMEEMGKSTAVMKFFPKLLSVEETRGMLEGFNRHYAKYGYTYYAVDELVSGKLIGFIGIKYQTYETHFNPAIDIGWRLHPNFWRKGYATEGAKACVNHAFTQLPITEIVSVAPAINLPSIKVMESIGMTFIENFSHPLLKEHESIKECVLYKLTKSKGI